MLKSLTAALSLLTLMSPVANATAIGKLETVAEFTDSRPGNVTVTSEGRIIVSMQPLDGPKFRVVEVLADGTKQPFPTTDWADGPENGKVGMTAVIGVDTDSNDIVWMLDMGGKDSPAKLVGWNSVKNTLHATIEITPSAMVENSFLQDFAIDEVRQKIYIADMTLGNLAGETKPAMIVVDLKTGQSHRVLEGNSAFLSPDRDMVVEGSLLASKSEEGKVTKLRFGLNPIAIDTNNEWVYFGTINGEKVFRIPAAFLASDAMADAERAATIEEYGPKRPSDGFIFAPGGGILTSDSENDAVGLTTKGNYTVLVQDKQLSWPDGFAVSNGWVYVTQNQLHLHPAFSQGAGKGVLPYKLMRFSYEL
jgi:hypothetical protein